MVLFTSLIYFKNNLLIAHLFPDRIRKNKQTAVLTVIKLYYLFTDMDISCILGYYHHLVPVIKVLFYAHVFV